MRREELQRPGDGAADAGPNQAGRDYSRSGPGADTLAGEYARDRGIPCRSFPADWRRHGRPAGFIRNRQMLDEGKPELVVAFPGGPGTRNMVKTALERGFPVKTVDEAGKIHTLRPTVRTE